MCRTYPVQQMTFGDLTLTLTFARRLKYGTSSYLPLYAFCVNSADQRCASWARKPVMWTVVLTFDLTLTWPLTSFSKIFGVLKIRLVKSVRLPFSPPFYDHPFGS